VAKTFFLLPFFLLAGSLAYSDPQIFYGEDAVSPSLRPAKLSSNIKAVHGYTLEGAGCTLVQVSNSGYALTNRHCLADYLRDHASFSRSRFELPTGEKIFSENYDQEKLRTLGGVLEQKTQLEFLQESIDAKAKEEFNPSEAIPFKIIVVPDGSLSAEILDVELFKFYRERNLGTISDFALIKLETANRSCVKIGNQKPGSPIYSVGFPGYAKRVSDGTTVTLNAPTISLGFDCFADDRTFDGQMANLKELKKFFDDLQFKTNIDKIKQIERELSDVLISHSSHLDRGNSGSGLFNDNGDLIGINVGIFNLYKTGNPAKDYAPGAYMAIKIDKIQKDLKKYLTPEEYAEAFRCEPVN
jgi:hypothetical protein